MARSSINRKVKFTMPRDIDAMPKSFYSHAHKHGCRLCNHLLICNCNTPADDPLCAMCLHGRDRPFFPEGTWPRDCCRYDATPAQRDKINAHLLAGRREWFICHGCGRQHPYDPSRVENEPPRTREGWVERFGPLPDIPLTSASEFTRHVNNRRHA